MSNINLNFNSIDIDLMYKYLPFIIYDESSDYIKVLKNKFVIEEMYRSHLNDFNDDDFTINNINYKEIATLSKLFIVLEQFPIEIIQQHIEERLEKIMQGKNFRIPKSIAIEGDDDNIMFQPLNDREIDSEQDSLNDVLIKMKIDINILNSMLEYILSVYDIYEEKSITNNEPLKENFQYMLAKTSTYIYNINQYYKNFCSMYKIRDASKTILTDESMINNIIELSGLLTTIYICLDQTNNIQLTAIKLNVMYNAIYMYIEIIKQENNFDENIHKHILLNGINIYLYQSYLYDYEFYAEEFKNYCLKYYRKIASEAYLTYNNLIEESVLKKYYRSVVVVNYLRANSFLTINNSESVIVGELLKLDFEFDPGLTRNKDNVKLSNWKPKNKRNLEYKFEDFINMNSDCKECSDIIHELMSHSLNEINTKIDSTLPARIRTAILKYNEVYQNFPDINFWLHQNNKIEKYTKKTNETRTTTKRAKINIDGTVNLETWHNIWLNSKNILENVMANIKNNIKILNSNENQYKKEELLLEIENDLSMIYYNYTFYNSDVFKNDLINQFDYKILQYIIGAFYEIYNLNIENINNYNKQFEDLCDQLSIIYFKERLNELIKEFWIKFSKERLMEVLLVSFMLKKIYGYDNDVDLWTNYNTTMENHFTIYVDKYLKEFNNNSLHEHERIYIGYKLLIYISKLSRYGTLNEKYKEIYNSIKENYNYIDKYIENGTINDTPNISTIINGSQFGFKEIRCNIPEFNITDLEL